MKREVLAYLAGLLDGEGAISLRKHKKGFMVAEVSIVNTDDGVNIIQTAR